MSCDLKTERWMLKCKLMCCFVFCVFKYGKVIDSMWVVKDRHGVSAWM